MTNYPILSKFDKRADRVTTIAQDFKAGYIANAKVAEATKGAKHIFLHGNHEDRFRRYLWQRAPELVGYAPTIEKALELEENGWNVTQYLDYIRVGKLLVTHDIGYYGVNAVRQTLTGASCSVLFGHTHRIGYAIEGDGTGKRRIGTTIGWLGDFSKIDYSYKWKIARDWTHGFAYAVIDDRTGVALVTTVPIVDYRCAIGTKVIKG